MDVDKPVSVRTAVAVGLGIAGVVALVVSWFVDDLAEPASPAWLTWLGTVAVIVALLTVVRSQLASHAVVAALLGLAVTGLAVWGFVDQYGRGYPGTSTVVAAVGGVAVTVTALMALRFRAERGWRPKAVVAAVVAFLLVAAVPVVTAPALPDLAVSSTTAPAVEAPAVPESVSEVAWTAEFDGLVHDVVAAGAGVVVLLKDGVVALDGETGEVRWRRDRPGAEAVRIDASPDGATVVTQFRPRDRPTLRREFVDAFTGELRFATDHLDGLDVHPLDGPRGLVTQLTGTSHVVVAEDGATGHSLTDGARLWRYTVPGGCRVDPGWRAHFGVRPGMLLPMVCGDEFRYVLVDGTTGDVRWEHRIEMPAATLDVGARLAPDRGFVAVFADVEETAAEPGTYAVLDVATGTALPFARELDALLAGGVGVVRAGETSVLVDVTTGRTLTGDDTFLECAEDVTSAHLASGSVCVDPVGQDGYDLAFATYETSTPRRVGTVELPDDRSVHDLVAVAAPGAVVVAVLADPDAGDSWVAGLR